LSRSEEKPSMLHLKIVCSAAGEEGATLDPWPCPSFDRPEIINSSMKDQNNS